MHSPALSFSSLALCLLHAYATPHRPTLDIPPSNATVSISRFITANLTAVKELHTLVQPILPGRDTLTLPIYSFLVQHGSRKLLFDAGIRKDPLNLAPSLATLFTNGQFSPAAMDKDIFDVLKEAGIASSSIETVIWSHLHFDHIGDMSKFPNSTSLVIGSATDTSTYPSNPNASLLESDLAGRNVIRIDFAKSTLKINDLQAVDYFGDGSFYLVNTPGHVPGHLTALARVTANPPSFILLAGDTFHHPGQARPRPSLQANFPCPAHLVAGAGKHVSTDYFFSSGSHDGAFDIQSRAEPLLRIADGADSFWADPVVAAVSLEKVARWDAADNVLVLIAHDLTLVANLTGLSQNSGLSGLPYHPRTLNGWKKEGWKRNTVWNFIDYEGPAWIFSPLG
ncbi:Metallo-beta-lactamase superfamily protein [Mycena indigotica]|uniref:Metallo-beta-lactamase superfamily protein n=1 Tax=Mycena indigotica TaxID=2126181 RepID=A0A8H6SFK3_9AGAR|nr:Metallo-beta-lactamase superfamily protein [Mycena indigotica]KAF7297447.1 Metallo-beta-lactamase superfamily protein [Mycena indigotica]